MISRRKTTRIGTIAPQTTMMTVSLKIEKPDIILVESLLDQNCNALVMNFELKTRCRMSENTMTADGGLTGLQMQVCNLDDFIITEDSVPHFLLEPTHVSFILTQPVGHGMHIDICITDIELNVSPATITFVNRVLATMYQEVESAEETGPKILKFENLWGMKPFEESSYWFLKAEEAEEASSASYESDMTFYDRNDEICLASCRSIKISLEMEMGEDTLPLLTMYASFAAEARNWSTNMVMEATMAMQVSYYNMEKAVWEPLIEPVEVCKDGKYSHVPWEMKLEMKTNAGKEIAPIDITDEAAVLESIATRNPTKTMTLSSDSILDITFTNTGLEVLTQLSNSYAEATVAKFKLPSRETSKVLCPYNLQNWTGVPVRILKSDNYHFTFKDEGLNEIIVNPGSELPLQIRHANVPTRKLHQEQVAMILHFHIKDVARTFRIHVERADKRFYPLVKMDSSLVVPTEKTQQGIISDVSWQYGAMQINLRSTVQIRNLLFETMNVYYMTSNGTELELLATIKEGETYGLPLHVVHTGTGELFFSKKGFTISRHPFIWKNLMQELEMTNLMQCETRHETSGEKFYFIVVGAREQVFFENTSRRNLMSSSFEIQLKPAIKFQNCLPVEIKMSQLGQDRQLTLAPGETLHLSHLEATVDTIVILIPNYLDKCWSCTKILPGTDVETAVWSFKSHDSAATMSLELGISSVRVEDTQISTLYCPFWMLNKTGLVLSYKNLDDNSNVILHPPSLREPILFSYASKDYYNKKKAAIRVGAGEWSEKFSLDVPGSSGVVDCRTKGIVYQVAVSIQLTYNSLTKMVVFTPFYLIINDAPFGIEYQEYSRSGDPWKLIQETSSSPLWPKVDKEDKLLLLRVAGTTVVTAPFLYTEEESTTLKLNNEYGGIYVEVQITEGGTYITVRQYCPGNAPAFLINYTEYDITYYEKRDCNVRTLPPLYSTLFTWENPAGQRMLVFSGYENNEVEYDLRKDSIGELEVNYEEFVSIVSFLDGLQRVILLTTDPVLARGAHTLGENEPMDSVTVLSIQGMGISLIDDKKNIEILYMSLTNSGTIWKQCKISGRRYKKIEGAKLEKIEQAYNRYLNLKAIEEGPVPDEFEIDEKTKVNFKVMQMLSMGNAYIIARQHEPGLWATMSRSAHSSRLHVRLHRLQVDQQLPSATFPVVLAPVPPPRTVALTDARLYPIGNRPFIEVSIVERIMEHSNVRQYKYYKVLVQEFHIKSDMMLIAALNDMFPQKNLTEQESLEAFRQDMHKAQQHLEALTAESVINEQKNFYDNIHLSPLKVHFSFSMDGSSQVPTFVGKVLQGIGVTLTDMNDVILKLSYYERNYQFISQKGLKQEVHNHYMGQALKQLYVLVLGLDVLGNPYGLVVGLKKGVEDLFYEPLQGAVQGPGEFAEGLAIGVRSLVGHTVGGAAGAVSRITAAMGHGIAALSLDAEHQRMRRDLLNKPAASLPQGLARSGRGLVMGVVDGVTGVFTNPLDGAREEGVGGFFKGLGRGAVGLVARPATGVVDFASGSLDAVKRAADLTKDITRRRPPRYMVYGRLRPYSRMKAEGNKILLELEKGKYSNTDKYESHYVVAPNKLVVLCSDKRILYLVRNGIFGIWQVDWTYLWSEISEMPVLQAKNVLIKPEPKKKVLGMFTAATNVRVVAIEDQDSRTAFITTCERLINAAH